MDTQMMVEAYNLAGQNSLGIANFLVVAGIVTVAIMTIAVLGQQGVALNLEAIELEDSIRELRDMEAAIDSMIASVEIQLELMEIQAESVEDGLEECRPVPLTREEVTLGDTLLNWVG